MSSPKFIAALICISICLQLSSQNNPPSFQLNTTSYSIDEGSSLIIPITASDVDAGLFIENPNIVVMGTSTASGSGASPGNSWYSLFQNYLDQNVSGYTLNRLARGGYTTYHFREDGFVPSNPERALPDPNFSISRAIEFDPDIIVINMPSNDVTYRVTPQETYDNWQVFEQIAVNAGSEIYFHTNQPRLFSELSRKLELEEKANYVKSTYQHRAIVTYDSLVDYTDYELRDVYNADDIHPNDAGHELIYRQNIRALQHLLIKDEVSFTSDDLPSFVTLENIQDGEGRLIINTDFSNSGNYNFSINAIDRNGNASSQAISLQVNEVPTKGGTQELTSFNYSTNNGGILDYYVYYPENYDLDSLNKPVLISLHGLGERDGDPSKLLSLEWGVGSIARRADQGEDFPMMVISPHQLSDVGGEFNYFWNIDQLKELIDHVKSRYSVNENRVYLTGYSNGGQSAWQYAIEHTADLAALVTLAGRTDLRHQPQFGINLQNSTFACQLSDLPIKAYHGSNDIIITPDETVDMVNSINACDANQNAELVLLNDDHEIRTDVYGYSQNDNIYDWLLQFSKGEAPNDTQPPYFETTPIVTELSSGYATIELDINESGNIYWALTTQNEILEIEDVINGLGSIESGTIVSTGSITSVTIDGLIKNTDYRLSMVASDDEPIPNIQTSVTYLDFTTENIESEEIKTIYQLNITKAGVNPGLDGWNDLNFNIPNGQGRTFDLIDSESNGTPKKLTAWNLVNGSGYMTVTDNWGSLNGQTPFPDEVVRYTAWTSSTINMELSGLNLDNSYDITFFSSRNSGNRNTTFTIFGDSKTVKSSLNTSDLVIFNDLQPNGEGKIPMSFSKDNDNYGYINTIIVEEVITQVGDTVLPKPVTNLSAVVDDNNIVTLNWDESTDADFSSFILYRSSVDIISNDLNLATQSGIQSNSAIDNTAEPGNTYYYWVATLDFAGNISNIDSSIEVVIEDENFVDAPFLTNIIATDESISIDWSFSGDVNELEKFLITRSINSGPFEIVAELNNSLLSFTDANVVYDSIYSYAIIAEDLEGFQSESSNVLAAELIRPILVPNPPVLDSLKIDNGNSVDIFWSHDQTYGFSHYKILRSTSSIVDVENGIVIGDNITDTFFKDTNVIEKESYFYRIIAVNNELVDSEPSNEISIEIPDITNPLPPTSLNSISGINMITLEWISSTSNDVVNNRVYRGIGSPPQLINTNLITTITSNQDTYIDNEAVEGILYYYAVTAIDEAGNESVSSNSTFNSTVDTTPPSKPASPGLSLLGDNSIQIDWIPNSEADVFEYSLWKATSLFATTGDAELVYDGVNNSYLDNITNEKTIYYYALTATDVQGNVSVLSDIVSIETLDVTAPSSPTNIIATSGQETIDIAWQANTEEDVAGYNVYIATVNDESVILNSLYGSVADPGLSYPYIVEEQLVYFIVTALDEVGNESSPSVIVSQKIQNLAPPTQPAGLLLTLNNDNSVALIWDANPETDLASYNVWRSTSEFFLTENAELIASSATANYLDPSTVEKTIYYYGVTSVDVAGNESVLSGLQTIETDDITPPGIPQGLVGVSGNNEILLDWQDNTDDDIAGYNIYSSTNSDEQTILSNLSASVTASEFSYELEEEELTTYFIVTAIDEAGNESDVSSIIGQKILNILPPSSPTGVNAIVYDRNNIALNWTTSDENDFSYYTIYRGLNNDLTGDATNILISNLNTNSFDDLVLEYETNYYYAISATDIAGNESALSNVVSVVTEEEVSVPVLTQVVQINITNSSNASGLNDWNDLDFNVPNYQERSFDLSDAEGNNTSKRLVTWNLANGSGYMKVADNGSSLNNKTPLPNLVARHTAWTSSTAKIELRNLDQDKIYSISIFSSRTSTNRITRFNVLGQTQTVLSSNNLNEFVVYEGLIANEQGTIPINFSKDNSNYGYINAMIIEEYTNPDFIAGRVASTSEVTNSDNALASSLSETIEMYPNPASSFITIKIPKESFDENVQVSLMDLNGRILHNELIQGNNEAKIPVHAYERGIYLIRISDSEIIFNKKVIIK